MKKKVIAVLLAGVMSLGATAAAQASSGWYEENGQYLTVHIPLSEGVAWEVTPVNDGGVEFITGQTEGGEWSGTFVYSGAYTGNDQLELICSVDGVSYGHYTLNLWIVENGEIDVTDDYGEVEDYTPVSEEYEEDSSESTSSESASSSESDVTEFAQAGFEAYTAYITAEDGLMLRNGPGSGYDVIVVLDYGQAVTVTGLQDGWAMVSTETGRTGYCSSSYVSKTKPSQTSANKETKENTEEKKTEDPWFEKSNGDTVLTIKVPADIQQQKTWHYQASDKEILELLTQETTTEDEKEVWTASFKGTGEKAGDVDLLVTRTEENNDIDLSYQAELDVAEDDTIRVLGAQKAWLTADSETGILTLNLPGNQELSDTWSYEIADTDVVELVNSTYIEEEDDKQDEVVTDGYWNGSFRGVTEGETTMTLTHHKADETEKKLLLKLSVDSSAKVHVLSIENVES